MEYYRNADEQAELVKNWLKKYALSVVIGLMLGIALIYGLRYWNGLRTQKVEKATDAYFMLLNSTADPAKTEKMAENIVSQYPKTPYASMAQFFLTQQAVSENQLPAAETHLQWVIDHAHALSFQQIARLRLARILLSEKKFTQAEQTLAEVDDKTYLPLIDMVKGDIALAQNQYSNAKNSYQLALKNADRFEGLQSMLHLKMSDPRLSGAA